MQHGSGGAAAVSSAAAPTAGQLPGGYTGRILRADLDSGRTWSTPWSPEDMRAYLGGVGLGAKLLWEEVPAKETPSAR